MGTYINPKDYSKENFLLNSIRANLCKEITRVEFRKLSFEALSDNNQVALIWVNNGPFTSLAVADTEEILIHIQGVSKSGNDKRPQNFFVCDKETALKHIRCDSSKDITYEKDKET